MLKKPLWAFALLSLTIITVGGYFYWQQTNSTDTPLIDSGPTEYKVIGSDLGLVELGQPGGELVFAINNPLETAANPVYEIIGYFPGKFFSLLHASLIDINLNLSKFEPALATNWESLNDNKEIVFHLRRNVKFSDGQPLTSEDVAFNFNAISNLGIDEIRPYDGLYPKNIEAEALDEWTIKVSSEEALQINTLLLPILPKPFLEKQIERLHYSVQSIIQLVEQTIDEQRQTFEYFAVDPVEAIDWALKDLEESVTEKSINSVNTLEEALKTNLRQLAEALTQEEPELKAQIDSLIEEVEQLSVYAETNRWKISNNIKYEHLWTVYEPSEQLVGAGPFRIKTYLPDEQLVLSRNPHYWKKDENDFTLPYLDQITVLNLNQDETELELFESGKIDLTMESVNFSESLKNNEELEKNLNGPYPIWITELLWWNDPARRSQTSSE